MIIPNVEARAYLDDWRARVAAGAGASELRIYAGAAPATAEESRAGATLLATLALNDTPFAAAVEFTGYAQIQSNAITPGAAVAAGTAMFADLVDGDGTVLGQVTVGQLGSGAELELENVAITVGMTVSVTSLQIRFNEAPTS